MRKKGKKREGTEGDDEVVGRMNVDDLYFFKYFFEKLLELFKRRNDACGSVRPLSFSLYENEIKARPLGPERGFRNERQCFSVDRQTFVYQSREAPFPRVASGGSRAAPAQKIRATETMEIKKEREERRHAPARGGNRND